MKIILSLVCLTALSNASDTFYAKVNPEDGKLMYITTNNEVKDYSVCDTNKNEHSKKTCFDMNYDATASSGHFQNLVTIKSNSNIFSQNKTNFECTSSLMEGNDYGNMKNLFCEQQHYFFPALLVDSISDTVKQNALAIALTPIGGIGLLILGKTTTYAFDVDKYNNFISMYGLEKNKLNIFSDLKLTQTKKFLPCDISTYEAQDYASITPETACKHGIDEGLFVYRRSKGMFTDEKNEIIGLYGADEVKDPLLISQKIVQRMIENYMDVVALHPEIPLPKTLPQLVLEKSQFEKESDFQKRKTKALSERSNEQKLLNEAYINAVKQRNIAIFEELQNRKATVKDKIVEFRKQAFMAVATPPSFTFENYDAENEKLYGKFSFGDNAYRVVSSGVNANIGEKVFDKSVTLTPQANYELIQSGDSGTFQTKELLLMAGSDKLRFEYTDNRYAPPSMKLVIPSYDISAFQDGIADATKEAATISSTALKALQDLERYRIKSQLAISDTAIHRVNAKTPTWYENPNCGQEKCAVGRGESQPEALKIALAQLGCILKSSIESELMMKKTVTDDVSEQKQTSYIVQQSCSNTFNEGELKLTNTVEMDGWYYVRTVMNSSKI